MVIKNEEDYRKEYYRQQKLQEDLYIKEFSPKRILFSDGTELTCDTGGEFDRDIIEAILESGRQ